MKTVISIKFDRTQTRKQKDGSYVSSIADVTYLRETLQFKDGIKTKHAVNKSLDYAEGMLTDMFTSLYDAGKTIPGKIYGVIETSTGLTFNTHAQAKMLLQSGNSIAKSAFTINITKKDKETLNVKELAEKYVKQFRSNVQFIAGYSAKRSNAALSFDANGKAANNVALHPVKVSKDGSLTNDIQPLIETVVNA